MVVASKGGSPEHPAWYLNLEADPEVTVQVLGDRFKARARTASPDEKPELWRLMTSAWPAYDEYQRQTAREIPVVVLERGSERGVRSRRRLVFPPLALRRHRRRRDERAWRWSRTSSGRQVTGSDRAESSYTEHLREHGIEPVIGHAAANVPAGAEVVYSTAVAADNPERQAAQGRELHRADLLAQIAALKRCMAVTGTHGKTTTSAMVVHALRGVGLDPAYVIGGELRDTGSNAAWGQGEWIVVEADESDRSLLKLDPDVAVLTNAELDHHSTYAQGSTSSRPSRCSWTRAGTARWCGIGPQLRALCPPGAVRLRRPRRRPVDGRIAVSLARHRGRRSRCPESTTRSTPPAR